MSRDPIGGGTDPARECFLCLFCYCLYKLFSSQVRKLLAVVFQASSCDATLRGDRLLCMPFLLGPAARWFSDFFQRHVF